MSKRPRKTLNGYTAGGAFEIYGTKSTSIIDSQFVKNCMYGGNGGAVYFQGPVLAVSGCHFQDGVVDGLFGGVRSKLGYKSNHYYNRGYDFGLALWNKQQGDDE